MTDDTEMGVDFGDLNDEIEDHEYPTDSETLLNQYGDETVTFSDEEVTVRELLEPMGEQEFATPEEVREAMLTMVGDAAIGRKNYSDRTPPAPGEERQDEGAPGQDVPEDQESF
jgi:hypothetical protein